MQAAMGSNEGTNVLKSDYFRIEIFRRGFVGVYGVTLKSDYFRIEISLQRRFWVCCTLLKSDYFRIEIEHLKSKGYQKYSAKIRLF